MSRKRDLLDPQYNVNLSSEKDEYSSDERHTFRKPHDFEERYSFPDTFESIGPASKKKNTPLKSINTKTKESLSIYNKDVTPNKSFEKLNYNNYDTNDLKIGDHLYKYTHLEGNINGIKEFRSQISNPFKKGLFNVE